MNPKLAASINTKRNFLKSDPLGYIISSMCAGALISIGIFISMRVTSVFADAWGLILSGLMFSIALNLIVIWRLELFTGNAMITLIGGIKRQMGFKMIIAILLVSYAANLLGVLLITSLAYFSGAIHPESAELIAQVCQAKMAAPPQTVFMRGVFCNILICIAILCSYYLENECARIFIVSISIITFMTLGFEHSIADMASFSIYAYAGGPLAEIIPFILNVSIGNLVGGAALVGVPYILITRKK